MSDPNEAGGEVSHAPFSIDDVEHPIGDPECSACYSEDYPKPCRCGGLIHDQFIGEGEYTILTQKRCDRCGEEFGNVEEDVTTSPEPNATGLDAPPDGQP